ncbi:MAG TPA: hypothetical protein VM888_08730 [Chitinophagaceae bacterium]|nr:hypothetical protein [Chitinophagaceae bacterium]
MQLANITMLRECRISLSKLFSTFFLLFSFFFLAAQDNSPYSRYGLGNIVPPTNISTRSMGGISAGYSDILSVNFNNPASYSTFQTFVEERSKKLVSGRVLLDVGVNIESRTLRVPNQPQKFTSSNALFSYIQLGVPLRKNWGLSFGLRPLSRVSYKIAKREKLFDPRTGLGIDSAFTEFTGDGGSYLPSIGTGFAIKNFSAGVNVGYLFGRKAASTRRSLFNDTVTYNNSNHTSTTSFGDVFLNAGAQYRIDLTGNKEASRQTFIRLGIAGNLQQNISASQDIVRETFSRDATAGDSRIDSVYEQNDIKSSITYPASYTAGLVVEHIKEKGDGWLLGADLTQTKWSNFRYLGTLDSVQNNWQLHVGGQYRPAFGRAYFSKVAYRAGFFVGKDYIRVQQGLPQLGVTLGMSLPVITNNRQSIGQFTVVNVALEVERRGNNENLLKENMFRLSVGLNFSDLWFNKRKYD